MRPTGTRREQSEAEKGTKNDKQDRKDIGRLLAMLIERVGLQKKFVAITWLGIKPSHFTKYFAGERATITKEQAEKLLEHAVELRMTPDEYRRIAAFKDLPSDTLTAEKGCSVTLFAPASTLTLPLATQILQRQRSPGPSESVPFRLEWCPSAPSTGMPCHRYSGLDVLEQVKKTPASVGIAHDEWVRRRRTDFMPIARISGGFRPRLYVLHSLWRDWVDHTPGMPGIFSDFIKHGFEKVKPSGNQLHFAFSNRTVADGVLQDLQKVMRMDDAAWRGWFRQDPTWDYDRIVEIPEMHKTEMPHLVLTWAPAGFRLMYNRLYIEVSSEFYSYLFELFDFPRDGKLKANQPHFSRECHAYEQDIYTQLSTFETTATVFSTVDHALGPIAHTVVSLVRDACELMEQKRWQYYIPEMLKTMWAIVQPAAIGSQGLPDMRTGSASAKQEFQALRQYAELMLERFKPSVRYELEYTEAVEKRLKALSKATAAERGIALGNE